MEASQGNKLMVVVGISVLLSSSSFAVAMVVTLRRNRRGRFTRASSSHPHSGRSPSPLEAVVASRVEDSSFALSAVMNPDSTHSPLFLADLNLSMYLFNNFES
ncbi:hypothetical protein F2Q68_00013527 [Brassica cretica]|uniref:Uncharacterized protein n=1 Tax=Brassica cretica TaxID=69181 RepID=A0A8S9HCF2_BRACR|nr:hypothetical protein F2Q68_00013527 [Brassica cretica]